MTRRGAVSGNARAIHYSEFKHLADTTAFVCTFKFNEVWIQLVARRPTLYGATLPASVRFTTQPVVGTWDDYVTELWPSLPITVNWPLPISLGDDSVFDRLAHRLAGSGT
jgi:hypothetical protein